MDLVSFTGLCSRHHVETGSGLPNPKLLTQGAKPKQPTSSTLHIVLTNTRKKLKSIWSHACCLFAGLLGSTRFTGSSQNYSTLLLEEASGLLYVGGRGALYALNTSNISTPGNLTVSVETPRATSRPRNGRRTPHITSFLPFFKR